MIEVPVLICGAGGAGLTAAVTLSRYGVSAWVVDRRTEASSFPRATALSLRSVEIFRWLGVAGPIREGADDAELMAFSCTTLDRAGDGFADVVGYPTRAQASAISPETPLCVAQDHVEEQLTAHVGGSETVTLRLGLELIGLEPRDGHVCCELRDVRTGEVITVCASYVIGADGARSSVRDLLGIRMDGIDDALTGVRAELRAPFWDLVGPHRYVIYSVTTPGAEGNFLPAGRHDRWLYGVFSSHVESVPAEALPAEIERRIREGVGRSGVPFTVQRMAPFTSAAMLAERFGDGNVFLAGDAAHRVTPRGGTGLNTAIHDGFDIAWKLAWVLQGWSTSSILDSYERERRPVAEHNVRRSADPRGSVRTVDQEIQADLGGRVAHAWMEGGSRSTLDVLGPGLTVLCGPEAPGQAADRGRPPRTVCRLDLTTAEAIGLPDHGQLLVRPDGKPLAVAPIE